jgi:glycosyltransferase involved in cell wall biosynthesis
MPGPPLDRAAAFARRFADTVPTVVLAPSYPDNQRLGTAVAPAALEFVAPGRLEGVWKWNWLRKHRPEMIYCVGGWFRNVLPAILTRPFTGSKVIADFDEVMSHWPSRKRWVYRLLERVVIPRLDGLVVVSAAMETWAIEVGADPDRIIRVPFAADTRAIADIASRANPPLPNRTSVEIGYLGSLTPHYDFWFLLDALETVRARWPDAILHLVGDGTARAAFEAQAQARGLHGRIRFHGFLTLPFPGIPNPPEEAVMCLAQCDALLFPIRDTDINRLRCPQKSYVYLATGTPIVTCAVGEVPGACEDFAQYFDMADPSSLIAALEAAMPEAPERRALRREFAVDRHSWEARSRDCWAQLSRGIFSPTS